MLLKCGVRTLESPLCSKEIKPVNPKGNQSWIFIGRTDAEAPILWPLDAENCLIGKDSDAGKDWRHKKKGMTEDEMVGWHHGLDGHKSEQAPGIGDEQGSLACCTCKELDTTEWLNSSNAAAKQVSPHFNIVSSLSPSKKGIQKLFLFEDFFLFIFNWRIIALQCCVGFCHTSVWTGHKYTYVPSVLTLLPTSHPL